MQDMKSVYLDIRDSVINTKNDEKNQQMQIDFSDIEFEVDLLKTDEINLDYILKLILEKSKESANKEGLKTEINRAIKSTVTTRAKEELILNFINKTELSKLKNNDDISESFNNFAKEEKKKEITNLINEEKLKDSATFFITKAIKKGHVECTGGELNEILPPTSRKRGARENKKQFLLKKIKKIVEVFAGI